MLRHVFVCPAKSGVTQEQIEGVVRTMRKLAEACPQIETATVGASLGLSDEAPGIVLVADFASVDAWRDYMSDDAHLHIGSQIVEFLDVERGTVTQNVIEGEQAV